MQVKIFSGFGTDDMTRVQTEINEWLRGLASTVEVKNTQTSLCQGQEGVNPHPCLVVTVWYE